MGGKLKNNIFTRLMSKISELCLGTRMEINTFGKERDVYLSKNARFNYLISDKKSEIS